MLNVMMLENKTALITGAARGIGKQIALAYAKEGCNIAFTDLELNEAAQATRDEIAALGVKVQFYASNAASFDAAHGVVEQVVADFGSLDILVNNAGVTKDGLLMSMSEEDYDKVLNINLKGAFNMMRHFSRAFLKQRAGRIINISSVSGVLGNAGQANYSASKAGIIGLTKSAAR